MPGQSSAAADHADAVLRFSSQNGQLRHCVAVYARLCRSGLTSIWTMELNQKGKVAKVLTIEVRNRLNRIAQARGPDNAAPTVQARKVLEGWAAATGLCMARWV